MQLEGKSIHFTYGPNRDTIEDSVENRLAWGEFKTRGNTLMRLSTFSVLLLALVIQASPLQASRNYAKIKLSSEVTAKINVAFRMAEALHIAMVTSSEQVVLSQTQSVIYSLDAALKLAASSRVPSSVSSVGFHQERNLELVLLEARKSFESAAKASGDDQKDRMKEGFKQLVALMKSYDIVKGYSVFFCPKNKAVWFQKNTKVRNPFGASEHLKCGVAVR
jgi:hypothetical protein